jgi:hypothetical protein
VEEAHVEAVNGHLCATPAAALLLPGCRATKLRAEWNGSCSGKIGAVGGRDGWGDVVVCGRLELGG